MTFAPQVFVNSLDGTTVRVDLPETGNLYYELFKATDTLPKIGRIGKVTNFIIGTEILSEHLLIENAGLGQESNISMITHGERLILPLKMAKDYPTIVLYGTLSEIKIPILNQDSNNTEYIGLDQYMENRIQEMWLLLGSSFKKIEDITNFELLFSYYDMNRIHMAVFGRYISYHLKQITVIQKSQLGFRDYTLSIREDLTSIKPLRESFSFRHYNCQNPIFVYEPISDFRHYANKVLYKLSNNLREPYLYEVITQRWLDGLRYSDYNVIKQRWLDDSYDRGAWKIVKTEECIDHALFHENLV